MSVRPSIRQQAEKRFFEYLEARGLRLTRERRHIVRLLFSGGPLDPERILLRARARGKPVSRATLYRTLDLLMRSGLVRHVVRAPASSPRGRVARYEPALDGARLGRMVCLSCGRLSEMASPALAREQDRACARQGFLPQHVHLEVFGLCRRCRRRPEDGRSG